MSSRSRSRSRDRSGRSASRSPSRSRDRSRKSRSRSPARRGGDFPPSNTLHSVLVSDLPDDMTKAEMEDIFGKYGKIGDIFLPKHRDHGRGRGFGFVRFCERDAQEDCVDDAKRKGIEIDRREVRVEFAKTRPPFRGYADERRGGDRDRGDRDRRGGGGDRDRRQRSRSRSPPRRQRSRSRSRDRRRY